MVVYRLCKSTYAHDLAGTGAALYGDRWNFKGVPLLYTSASTSLTILEYLAHNLHLIRTTELSLLKLQLPHKSQVEPIRPSQLPNDWQNLTYIPQGTQKIGNQFIENQKSYGLQVPSAVVPNEFNILLNPAHPDHQNLKIIEVISPFEIDQRLSVL